MPPRMSAGKIAGIKPRRVAQRIASAQCDWLGDGVSANLNNMPQTVEQALELIRENQPDATDRALSLLQNTVYSVSMKVCGHRQDAEDTMQDVLLKSIPHLAKFDDPQALKVWLYKVARNRCMSRHRGAKSSRAKNLSLDELMPSSFELQELLRSRVPDPEETLLNNEDAEQLKQAIMAVPILYRMVLVLHDM